MKYRSKPSEIEAVQLVGELPIVELFDFAGHVVRVPPGTETLELLAGKNGAQGWVPVPDGHWIVRNPGDVTDYWPVDPDYFAAKYEPVEDSDDAAHP